MIKLIKITRKYINGEYTTDKHNLIFGIPLLQECLKMTLLFIHNYLCLNIHQVTFDYSTVEAYIAWKLISRQLKMIQTNRFQIVNPDILKVIPYYARGRTVQITYMCKEMHRSTVLFTPELP